MSIRYDVDGSIARVTIDRAERMNALDGPSADELEAVWDRVEADRSVRAVVLTGAGDKAFCAGADMKADAVEKSGLEYWADARAGGFGGLPMRRSLSVPVIARVNGFAVGGGFELVLGCDIVIAAEHASFGLPEARVGRMPLDGGMIQLPRMIPRKIAMGMLLTGARVGATDGARYGFVNEVVPAAELDAAVDRWCADIVACAPLSVRAIKESVQQTIDLPAGDAYRARLPWLVAALESEDADEGPRAFREKRSPEWQGR